MPLLFESYKSLLFILITGHCATCNLPNHDKLYWRKYVYHPTDQLLVLHGLSIADCVRECQLRPGCLSVNYKKYLHKCEINDVSAQPDLSFNSRVVSTKRQDWKEDLSTLCKPTCNGGQRCNPQSRKCHIHECDPPSVVSNAVVNGNRRLVGSKIQYKCTANTSIAFISVCLDTGKWSTVPDCPPVDCGVPSFEGYVFEIPTSTGYGGTVSVSCAFYCGLDNLKMTVTCLANGSWEQPSGCSKPDDYKIGCHRDTGSRALSHRMYPEASAMTPAVCIKYCIDKRYQIAGLQAGYACFCGSAGDNYDQYGVATNCNSACNGDRNQLCGGRWANMVYNTSPCVA